MGVWQQRKKWWFLWDKVQVLGYIKVLSYLRAFLMFSFLIAGLHLKGFELISSFSGQVLNSWVSYSSSLSVLNSPSATFTFSLIELYYIIVQQHANLRCSFPFGHFSCFHILGPLQPIWLQLEASFDYISYAPMCSNCIDQEVESFLHKLSIFLFK